MKHNRAKHDRTRSACTQEGECGLYANTMPLHLRDMSTEYFSVLAGWERDGGAGTNPLQINVG